MLKGSAIGAALAFTGDGLVDMTEGSMRLTTAFGAAKANPGRDLVLPWVLCHRHHLRSASLGH